MKRVLLCALVLAWTGFGQSAQFEAQAPACGYAFPAPCGAAGDPEGVSWNGLTGADAPGPPTVDTANVIGMPCGLSQYARVHGQGPLAVPPGGPMPPAPLVGDQLFIPIPAGAVTVSFCWDFYDADTLASAAFNDGMSIDIIGGCGGASLVNLVYADSFSPSTAFGADLGSPCATGGAEVLPAGVPQVVVGAAIPAGAAFIQVTVWNGGDNSFYSDGVIDQVCFNGVCGPPACSLSFTSPLGAGSLLIVNTPCAPLALQNYQIGVTFAPGAFPSGWFFGLDITLTDLINQHGAVFAGILWGTLDAAGGSSFGPVPGLPSGLPIWAVSSTWTSPGFGASLGARPPVMYIIP